MSVAASAEHQVTQLLAEWRGGNETALARLIPLVQPELHRLASYHMKRERQGHTLQTTALINEAYLRLADKTHPQWEDSTHFFAVAGQLMRRVMVDHARQRQALKRGAAPLQVTLDETALVAQSRAADLLALDEALERLGKLDPRMCQIVEMRYFGGLSIAEVARVLQVHPNTVKTDWNAAKAWLYAALTDGDDA